MTELNNSVVEQSTVTPQDASSATQTTSFELLIKEDIVQTLENGTILFLNEIVCKTQQDAIDAYSIYLQISKTEKNKTIKQIIKAIKDEFKRRESIEKQILKIAKEEAKRKSEQMKEEKQNKKAEFVADKQAYYSEFSLDLDDNGHPMQNAGNYKAALSIKSEFGEFKWNEFAELVELNGRTITDNDIILIYNKMSDLFGMESYKKIDNAIIELALENKYHPIKQYLELLKWDGINRVDTLLHDILGAEDTELCRIQTRLFLYAAIKRVYKPGCKFDNMLVLYGQQGNGKSTFCEHLAVNDKWYNDNIEINHDKDSLLYLQDAWIVIMDEMDAWGRADTNAAKGFITKRSDKFRAPFGKTAQEHLRHCVFIGNTNDDTFLKDTTGLFERRYWVITTTGDWRTSRDKIKKFTEPGFVDQVWAEMKQYYDENPYLELVIPEHLYEEQVKQQLQYKVDNDCQEYDFIEDILNQNYSESIYANNFRLHEEYLKIENNGTSVGDYKKRDFFFISSLNYLFEQKHWFKKKSTFKSFAKWSQTSQWCGSQWEYKEKSYNGKTYKALIRIDSESDADDPKKIKFNGLSDKDNEALNAFM